MHDVTCPECGHETSLVAIRRGAEEFCGHCDFPLFWAETAIPALTPGGNNSDTLRRLPGAGGRRRIGSKICPECGELNPVGNVHCLRCGEELDPRPAEPAAEPVVMAPLPPPAPVWVEEPSGIPWFVWAFWATMSATLVLALVTR